MIEEIVGKYAATLHFFPIYCLIAESIDIRNWPLNRGNDFILRQNVSAAIECDGINAISSTKH